MKLTNSTLYLVEVKKSGSIYGVEKLTENTLLNILAREGAFDQAPDGVVAEGDDEEEIVIKFNKKFIVIGGENDEDVVE